MKCEVCHETELEGEIAVLTASVSSDPLNEEVTILSLMGMARFNHIVCDSCNKAVCHGCCSHAKSGYCDQCIQKYNLHNYVLDIEEAI